MKRILIIDDEIDVRKALSTALKLNDEGYEIACAGDGQSGMEIVSTFRPDLILLDIMLPGLSGIEVCRSLKTDDKYKSIQIIMLTALSQPENIVEGLSAGADDYVSKPFNMSELLARVTSHLKIKELYEKVKKSERRYETLLQSLPDVVYKLDLDGNFVFISDSVKKLGFEPQKIIGRHFSQIIHPDDLPSISRTVVLPKYAGKVTGDNKAPELFDERRSKERATKNLEFRLAPKERSEEKVDSEGLNVMVTIAFGEVVSAGEYDSESKETLGTVGVIRDISERKKIEGLLKAEKERFFTTLEKIPAFVYLQAQDYSIRYANETFRRLFGNPEGKLCHKVMEGRDKPCETCLTFETLRTKTTEIREWKRNDNEIYMVYDNYLADSDGTPLVLEMGIDITDLKRAEETLNEYAMEMEQLAEKRATELYHADQMVKLGIMANNMVHEVNNPMAIISSSAQLLKIYWEGHLKKLVEKEIETSKDEKLDSILNDAPKSLEAMKVGIKRVSKITGDILEYYSLRKGSLKLESIAECIENSLNACGLDSYLKHKIKVEIDQPENMPNLLMNKYEIEKVFTNLFTNAIHAVEDKREAILNIITSFDLNKVVIKVIDNGSGIDEGIVSNIFNPFFTAKGTGKGAGLGLPVCYGIIEKYRGTITVSSKLGEGTTFTITLPIDLPQAKKI